MDRLNSKGMDQLKTSLTVHTVHLLYDRASKIQTKQELGYALFATASSTLQGKDYERTMKASNQTNLKYFSQTWQSKHLWTLCIT